MKGKNKKWANAQQISSNGFYSEWGEKSLSQVGNLKKKKKRKSSQRQEVAFFLPGVYLRVKKKKRNGLLSCYEQLWPLPPR